METGNIYRVPDRFTSREPEFFETMCRGKQMRIERIISSGHTTEPGNWYEQALSEWVVLLRGKASLEFEHGRMVHLSEGDYLLIPAGQRHRVAFTTTRPECIWLAVHFD